MQTTEVTQGQCKAVMGTEPWKGRNHVKEGANYPASYVNWDDTVAYCEKLSAKEGKTHRLPRGSRSAYRFSVVADYRYYGYGFRLVRELD